MIKKVHAIILARKNSKGIKNKNIINFNGKPLIYWTIKSCLESKMIFKTWVSSDSKKILNLAKKYNANIINRPSKISGDKSTSESGWQHAINHIKKQHSIDFVLAPQVTSPIREKGDFDQSLKYLFENNFDSLFSGTINEDYFHWRFNKNNYKPTYSLKKRPRRQDIRHKILENGSFYVFDAKKFEKKKVRLFGKIGFFNQKKYNSLQIDSYEDLKLLRKIHFAKNFK